MRVFLIVVSILALPACGSSPSAQQSLTDADKLQILHYVPDADLSALTPSQEGQLALILYGNSYPRDRAKGGQIRAILN